MHQDHHEVYDRKIVFFTGAGTSVESGVPAFRTNTGIWNDHEIDKVCNYDTWKSNYSLVHEFYNNMRTSLKDKEANLAHKLIAELQEKYSAHRVKIITTNVDTFFEEVKAKDTVYLHGKINEMVFPKGEIMNIGFEAWDFTNDGFYPDCEIGYKPNVVFFNELAPEYDRMHRILSGLGSQDIIVTIGASEEVVPVGQIMQNYGGLPTRIRINPAKDPHLMNYYDLIYNVPASEGMQMVKEYLEEIKF